MTTYAKALADKPPAPPAAEFYGEQPDPLPASVPVGTTWQLPAGDHGGVFTEPGVLSETEDGRYEGLAKSWSSHRSDLTDQRSVQAEWIDWKTVPRPAPSQAERVPEDVAALLAEARKYRPECVVERGRFYGVPALFIWRSIGSAVFATKREDWDEGRLGSESYGINDGREPLEKAIAESRVWPLADARKLAAISPPADGKTTAIREVTDDELDPRTFPPAQSAAVDPYTEHRKREEARKEPLFPTIHCCSCRTLITPDNVLSDAGESGWFCTGCKVQFELSRKRGWDDLDRLAASRMRSESSGRAERAERGRHDWDPEDAPELFATSGWSGR